MTTTTSDLNSLQLPLLPLKALRSWESYVEPDEDEVEDYMSQPFTRIVDAKDETVFTAHDLFTFSPGHAEFIVDACNSYGKMLDALTRIASGEGSPKAIANDVLVMLKTKID